MILFLIQRWRQDQQWPFYTLEKLIKQLVMVPEWDYTVLTNDLENLFEGESARADDYTTALEAMEGLPQKDHQNIFSLIKSWTRPIDPSHKAIKLCNGYSGSSDLQCILKKFQKIVSYNYEYIGRSIEKNG
jgi:hypothetical protein